MHLRWAANLFVGGIHREDKGLDEESEVLQASLSGAYQDDGKEHGSMCTAHVREFRDQRADNSDF
jgi:hypothetical protein